jgi:hypothetical protein
MPNSSTLPIQSKLTKLECEIFWRKFNKNEDMNLNQENDATGKMMGTLGTLKHVNKVGPGK